MSDEQQASGAKSNGSSTPSAVSHEPLDHVSPNQLPSMVAPPRCALLIIDVQEDFASPSGLLGRSGADLASAEATIDALESIIEAARKRDVPRVFMRVVTRPETDPSNLVTYMERKGVTGGAAICRAETSGANYYRVQPQAGEHEIEKQLYNSFHGTELDDYLQQHKIDTLILTGFSTDCCIDATARDAFHRGYHVFVASDACGTANPQLHISTLQCLSKHCALLVESGPLIDAWSTAPAVSEETRSSPVTGQ